MPLLRHCLNSPNAGDQAGLLKSLLRMAASLPCDKSSSTTTAPELPDTIDTPGNSKKKRRKSGGKTEPETGAQLDQEAPSDTAESLLHLALRSPGVPQDVALDVLSTRSYVALESGGIVDRQRKDLLRLLVEVNLQGPDGNAVAAAAAALRMVPSDVAAFIVELVPDVGEGGAAGADDTEVCEGFQLLRSSINDKTRAIVAMSGWRAAVTSGQTPSL